MMANSIHLGTAKAVIESQRGCRIRVSSRHFDSQGLVRATYRDHVHFHRSSPLAMAPQVRECVGWLVYNSPEYVVVCWDRDASPPALKGGDPKASGLVILRTDILELRRFGSD